VADRAERRPYGRTPDDAGLVYDEPFSTNGHAEEDAELRVALSRLPERQRTAVFLRYYADLDYAAIAEALGISAGTVAATRNQAHTTLRARLEVRA